MSVSMREMLEAGVHFGHQTRFWNPKMAPYIFGHRNKIHIINLEKTLALYQDALKFVRQLSARGGTILFVSTKRAAREIIAEEAQRCGMPYVDSRWLGGMLTNFNTVRKSVKKMQSIEKMLNDGTFDSITKKERLTLARDKDKMEKVLGGIAQLGRVPAALFIVDIGHEHIALAEAKRLGISTFGMVDTNCDPNKVDFAIPSNDDATKSIAIIVGYVTAAIADGLAERQAAKEEDVEETGNDENERKAARIQAEAENEAARARGEKVKGTSQPKRRIPNSGPRRAGSPR